MPTINEQVADRLKTIAPDVESKVVELMVEKETNRRVEIISQAIAKLDDMQREQRKLGKPDQQSFDGDGKEVSSGFSKERTEERKKLAEKMDKLSKALEKAIGGDLGDLNNLVKQ